MTLLHWYNFSFLLGKRFVDIGFGVSFNSKKKHSTKLTKTTFFIRSLSVPFLVACIDNLLLSILWTCPYHTSYEVSVSVDSMSSIRFRCVMSLFRILLFLKLLMFSLIRQFQLLPIFIYYSVFLLHIINCY